MKEIIVELNSDHNRFEIMRMVNESLTNYGLVFNYEGENEDYEDVWIIVANNDFDLFEVKEPIDEKA
jgi:hypothetical protein